MPQPFLLPRSAARFHGPSFFRSTNLFCRLRLLVEMLNEAKPRSPRLIQTLPLQLWAVVPNFISATSPTFLKFKRRLHP